MTEQTTRHLVPFPAGSVDGLLMMAGRAPSILNSQPWKFRVTRYTIELHADPERRLRADQAGREMLMSCGAALFGLRLGVRSIGYQPVTVLLPDPGRPGLLATVRLGTQSPVTEREQQMIDALPHRHTHRGPFAPGPLPPGLLVRLQHDAVAEQAELALVDRSFDYDRLATIVAQAARSQRADQAAQADIRRWVRPPGVRTRDGVPASAIPAHLGPQPGRLAQRDLDLGQGFGLLPSGGASAAATAVLLTEADTRADWLRAGQALNRLLTHAATMWVFASLHSQALEAPPVRDLIRVKLALLGAPQLLLEFGVAQATHATARRPADELIITGETNRREPKGARGRAGLKHSAAAGVG
jgi:hypothetical protein